MQEGRCHNFLIFLGYRPLNRMNPDEPVVPIGCYPINTMVSGHQRLTHSWHSPGRPRGRVHRETSDQRPKIQKDSDFKGPHRIYIVD
jgi:hypothetical protein